MVCFDHSFIAINKMETVRCTVCQQEIDFTLPSTQDNCLECMLSAINQSCGSTVLYTMIVGFTKQAPDLETKKRFLEKTEKALLKLTPPITPITL